MGMYGKWDHALGAFSRWDCHCSGMPNWLPVGCITCDQCGAIRPPLPFDSEIDRERKALDALQRELRPTYNHTPQDSKAEPCAFCCALERRLAKRRAFTSMLWHSIARLVLLGRVYLESRR